MTDEPQITLPPEDRTVLTFTAHMTNLDDFVADCNEELRKRGFHVCEASVAGNWAGEAVLTVTAMIDAPQQQGMPCMPIHCKLPLPWLMPEPHSVADILSQALQAAENAMVDLCGKNKVLRISFNEFVRRQSRELVIAPETNGRRVVLATP